MSTHALHTLDEQRIRLARRSRLIGAGVVLLSLAVAGLLLAFPPGWPGLILCAGVGFLLVTWYRPFYSVVAVLGASILFEQFDFGSYTPLTRQIPFFENASAFTNIDGFEASPLEMLLVIITITVVVRMVLGRQPVRQNPLAPPVIVFTVSMALWLVLGMLGGGQLNIALWEMRGLAYFCLLALLVPQVISEKREVAILLWVSIVMVIIKAVQGMWNFIFILGGDMSGERSVTGHEDALFMAWIIVLIVALQLYRTGVGQRVFVYLASPVLAATFMVTDRRAAYVALALGVMVLAVLVFKDASKRTLVIRSAIPLVLIGILMVGVGWNSSGVLGIPAQVVRSIIDPGNQEDIDSSYYRAAEEVNLIHAIESNPIAGLGFGRPYQESGALVDIGFSLADVIPHNEIMWIWAKMGTTGFAVFWAMFGSIIVFATIAYREIEDPYLRAVALFVACAVPMQLVVSYVDLQLTYARNMVFLGTLVAIAATLPRLAKNGTADVTD